LAFDYTVALTDTSVAALAATAMNLPTGAGIVDSGGNALAAQSLTGLAQSGPRIQPLLPVITGVTESPASGHLGVGASDTLTLTTNEPVTVSKAQKAKSVPGSVAAEFPCSFLFSVGGFSVLTPNIPVFCRWQIAN